MGHVVGAATRREMAWSPSAVGITLVAEAQGQLAAETAHQVIIHLSLLSSAKPQWLQCGFRHRDIDDGHCEAIRPTGHDIVFEW